MISPLYLCSFPYYLDVCLCYFLASFLHCCSFASSPSLCLLAIWIYAAFLLSVTAISSCLPLASVFLSPSFLVHPYNHNPATHRKDLEQHILACLVHSKTVLWS